MIEIVLPAAVLALGIASWAGLRWIRKPSKAYLDTCTYIVFEAEPVNLTGIETDLAACGWRLVSSQKTDTEAMLYRFEKEGGRSRSLSEIYDFAKSMPRTANRTTGARSVIRIREQGVIGS